MQSSKLMHFAIAFWATAKPRVDLPIIHIDMNVLILGSGGREHAIAHKISQSNLCKNLYIAPGNPGTETLGVNIPISISNFEAVKNLVIEKEIAIVIVGPEQPLVDGIWDVFQHEEKLKQVYLFGPSSRAAQLEGSKAFAKAFMHKYQIPTATYREFDTTRFDEGMNYIKHHRLPIVLKADGLAAGKGVVIAHSHEESLREFEEMIKNRKFGAASDKVVVEEFLTGIECSVFVITDGKGYKLLPVAKDYKRIGEGDTGLNTGGMGAISPVPFVNETFMEKVRVQVIEPTMRGIQEEGLHYHGFIFFGLINVEGNPYVIEYNCRMGDPETEVVMPLLESDLLELVLACKNGQLDTTPCKLSPLHAATVMLVSHGYPSNYETGKTIIGLDEITDSIVFHAGTKKEGIEIKTQGGRVLAITTVAESLSDALKNSLKNADKIQFDGKYYRRDIGWEFLR
jgi:phosphoribosylamine--glycine ligase